MKQTKSLQFHQRYAGGGVAVHATSSVGRGLPPPAEPPPSSLFVMEDDIPPTVVVNHPEIPRKAGGGGGVRVVNPSGSSGGRRGSGNPENVRVSFVRHPDIPDIREDEELAALPPRRTTTTRRKVSIQQNSPVTFANGIRSTTAAAAAAADDLYLVAPEPLELEYAYGDSNGRLGRGRRDRSLSLPAVHGNFRLLRSAQSLYR